MLQMALDVIHVVEAQKFVARTHLISLLALSVIRWLGELSCLSSSRPVCYYYACHTGEVLVVPPYRRHGRLLTVPTHCIKQWKGIHCANDFPWIET